MSQEAFISVENQERFKEYIKVNFLKSWSERIFCLVAKKNEMTHNRMV